MWQSAGRCHPRGRVTVYFFLCQCLLKEWVTERAQALLEMNYLPAYTEGSLLFFKPQGDVEVVLWGTVTSLTRLSAHTWARFGSEY